MDDMFGFNRGCYFSNMGMGTNIGATLRYGFWGFVVNWLSATNLTAYYLLENHQQERRFLFSDK